MKQLNSFINKAKKSSFDRWILNRILWRAIPFNSPHKFEITSITEDEVIIKMPYIRKNMNHIKGLHACGLATLCEYACGLQLMNVLGTTDYRIIMKELHMDYHFQGKTDVNVNFRFDTKDAESINSELMFNDAVFKNFELPVYDLQNNLVCTATVNWQIKKWDKVKTKV
ncbi:DUF4442 domain-containing protein [Solitalea sp. MAHUQ-68]|uniref:DUF4442 domain-containing protein n=1 Tax=Solitalea agri TaxID=2953739 RepID=A0A9X2F3P2_9SPHI|nr:DUF4442 domain-containing protein [Solitalea agri]MCO4293659.1 DUF4442 domain-containing protein [Solitalea agri]